MARIRITGDTKVSRNTAILSSNVDKEVVLLNIQKGEYTGLDEVATDIWNELDSPISVKDLVSRIMKLYSVEEQQCTEETIDLMKELVASGIVEIVNEEE